MPNRWLRKRDRVHWAGITPIVVQSSDWEQCEPGPEVQSKPGVDEPVTGWLLPPVASSIWIAVFTKQSNYLFIDVVYRAKAVYEHVRTLWNDFCLWSKERQKPQQEPWGEWSGQVGYEDPSENPAWRLKYTLEIKSWERARNTQFHMSATNAKWYASNFQDCFIRFSLITRK